MTEATEAQPSATPTVKKSSASGDFDLEEARTLRKRVCDAKRELAQVNSVSSESESVPVAQTEVKNYELNKLRAVRKLHAGNDRQDIEVERTGGGITMKLNTGTYQLVKNAAHTYFTDQGQLLSCAISPVFDKVGVQLTS